MSILHAYHSKLPFRNLKGKPYVTVSAKGISNGLSDTYNDGADFGPDTLLNATSPNQYGPPYTQTGGIQEAINYIASLGGGAVISEGNFNLSSTVIINNTALNNNFTWIHYNTITGTASPLIQLGDENNQLNSIYIEIDSILVNQGNVGLRIMNCVQSTFKIGSIYGNGSGTGIEFNPIGFSNMAARDNNIFFNVIQGVQYGIHYVKGSETTAQFAQGTRIYGGSIFGNGVTATPAYGLLIDSNCNAVLGLFIGTIDMSLAASPNYDFFDNNGGQWTVIASYIRGNNTQLVTPSNLITFPQLYMTITTPSIPPSGASNTVMNLYPFPMAVYINGSVTGVYITPYGKSQIQIYGSVSNPSVILNNGDSIALTYTTAPTWVWHRA